MFGDDTGSLAGNRAAALEGFSGMVPAGQEFTTDPNAGGRMDELGGGVVQTNPQPGSAFAPLFAVEDRPMLGGLRSAPHYELLRDAPAFDGSRTELRNRVSVMVLTPSEMIPPDVADELPSLRVPPISDPLGRVCANSRAIASR